MVRTDSQLYHSLDLCRYQGCKNRSGRPGGCRTNVSAVAEICQTCITVGCTNLNKIQQNH